MSKEFDNILREINKQNKELHNIDGIISKQVVKDILDTKKTIKNIENKIASMENTINQMFELINSITIFIDDAEDAIDGMNDEDEEDWTPYDDRNFSYNDNDEEDIGGDDYWSSKQDDS